MTSLLWPGPGHHSDMVMPAQTGPVGPGAGPGAIPQQDLSSNITATLGAAPELSQDPGTAVAVASNGGDVKGNAQAIAHGGNRTATATAVKAVQDSGGLFSDIGHDIGDIVSKVGHYANDGLSTVQHEYRYLHDVEARHGRMAALMEGAGLLAGAVVGTAVDPGEGTILGAEAAAWAEGQETYKDSWSRTLNPNYKDPHTGQLVSFGRDVASALHLGGGERTAVSGALDGLGDLIADPVGLVGKGLGEAHSIEGMGGLAGRTFQGTAVTAENVDQAYQTLPSVRRAFSDIAVSDAGDITRKYPQFVGIARELGDANTADEVKDTFKELASSAEMLDAQKLPTLSLSRQSVRPLRDVARNMGSSDSFLSNHVAHNVLLGPRRWADRLEALPGTTLTEGNDISGTQINPANTRGLRDIYNMVRYSGTDREARAVSDAYAYASPAQRIVIVKNATMKMLFQMAKVRVPEDGDMEDALTELVDGRTKKAILERLDNHLAAANIEGNIASKPYGVGVDGQIIKPVMGPDGAVQGGITANQTGNISLPNIVEARRMAQAIRSSRASRLLANADDFLYDHVTQGFFKPLVLMSGGYGLHISLAEAIPNTLRHGLAATANGMYDRAIASLGYRADEEEKKGFLTWLYNVAGRRAMNNSTDAQYLAQVYAANEGYKTTVGVSAGEITEGETQPVEKAMQGFRQKMAMGTKESGDFATFGNEDQRFPKLWQAELRENANDEWSRTAAQSYLSAAKRGEGQLEAAETARQAVATQLRNLPDDVKENFVRAQFKADGAPPGWDPIDSWAQAVVDKMRGAVHARPDPDAAPGEGGDAHMDLLESVAHGHTPTESDLAAIDPSQRPLMVKGRTVVPDGNGAVQRIANFGFRKILNPMVNIISRNQEFAVEYVQARRVLQPMVDQGLMTDDEAMIRAESQATTHSMRFVHNLHDRTQWTATARNWAPFYFAQEQAYRRMGRLLAEDPGAFRRYQMMISGAGHITANMQDSTTGQNYIAFPGSGWLGKGVADAMGLHGMTIGNIPPAVFGGSGSSANVIFPLSTGFNPDLGPIALVPMQQLYSFFPELGKEYPQFAPVTNVAASALADAAGGAYNLQNPIWEQLVPNTFVLRLIQAGAANDRSFNSAVMQAYQYADYEQGEATDKWVKDGRKGPPPQILPPQDASAQVKQAFANKIKNYVRGLFVMRAITGMVSPVSSEVEIQNFGFPTDLNNEIAKAGSVSQGMQNFILKYPNAVPYTVAQSFVPSDTDPSQPANYSLSSSVPAQEWVTQNQGLLDKYGVSALWLMPQLKNAQYSSTVYNEQIAEGLRIKDTPQQFLDALYTSAGDTEYYAGLTVHENALAAAGNSSAAKNAEYNSWDAWVAQLEKQYPVWAENHLSGVKQTNAQHSISVLDQMFKDGAAPHDEQSSLVLQLLEQYQTAAADYAAAGNVSTYSKQLTAQSQINDSWVQYVDNVAVTTPALEPIIASVFRDALKVAT